MEFDALLAVLLYEDCTAHVPTEAARLTLLAQANGTNLALARYLDYFNKTKKTPNPEQLKQFADSAPKSTLGIIDDELEKALFFKNAQPPGSFSIALENAWAEANRQYVKHGLQVANSLCSNSIPHDAGGKQFVKKMERRYGDQLNWDWVGVSQEWLADYLAKNPFAYKEEEQDHANDHEYVFAQGISIDEDDAAVTTRLMVMNATDIKPEPLLWLWPERIPQGTICWFTGKPNLGKSLATLDLIARLTTGNDFPDGEKNVLPPQDVLLAISEDNPSTTVIPRLMAAGANLEHVKFFHRVKLNEGSRQLQLSSDTRNLKRGLEANPTVTLIVLDPLESFSGDVDINKNQEIRPVMDALSSLCKRTRTTIVGIVHDNKRSDVSAIQKIPGGSAVAGAARSALGFSRDPDNRNEYFMSMVKGNLSKKQSGIRYTIGERTVDGLKAPFIIWGEEHDATADELLTQERDTGSRKDNKQITMARDFLPVALANGPRLAKELYAEAEEKGISVDTMKRAKNEMGGISVYKTNNGWIWSILRDDPTMDEV
jgi:hypothetical protein